MATLYSRAQIESVMRPADVVAAMEKAFAAYSRGEAVIPPAGHIDFTDPPGEGHIKYGYLRGGATFTVKIATGFYENSKRGLPSGDGVILVFSSQTGQLLTILQDESYLTDIRTAAAGAVAAKYLAREVRCIGIVGGGVQARLQLAYLATVLECRRAMIWARSADRAKAFHVEGFDVRIAANINDLLDECDLVVTTTPSREPLITADHVKAGTHITAVGADGAGKNEIDPALFARAKLCVVDSRSQCSKFGDTSFALQRGFIQPADLVEFGEIIEARQDPRNAQQYRREPNDITIADLTGVAVQDIAVAELALEKLRERDLPAAPR
jgi:ornithine cyclodeaminase